MSELSYEDAVQALRQHMSNRWDGREDEGREEMTRILKQNLGYDNAEADSTINAMIRAGYLRYHNLHDDAGLNGGTTQDEPGIVATGPQVTGGGLPGAPTAPGVDFGPGFWEIGQDQGDEIGGRRGQVAPR